MLCCPSGSTNSPVKAASCLGMEQGQRAAAQMHKADAVFRISRVQGQGVEGAAE